MLTLEEALQRLAAVTAPLPAEWRAVEAAAGGVLAADAVAQTDLPPFDQSALDGYALCSADARPGGTLQWPVVGASAAGPCATHPVLVPQTAMRVLTGAVVPAGADVVVAQEHTVRDGSQLTVQRLPAPGGGVRRRGEERRAGSVVAVAGTQLNPYVMAALATAGIATVPVVRSPRVALLVTGDEVVAPGQPLRLGQVYDANATLGRAWLRAEGCTVIAVHAVPDDAKAVREALATAFAEADVVLTTGGVSVGDHDHIPAQAAALGAEVLFWKVAQKPGKPLFAATHGGKLLLGLPGNPASVLVNLAVFARFALDRLRGLDRQALPWQHGYLLGDVRADADRGQWLRVAVSAEATGLQLRVLKGQASHMLSNSPDATGLAWVAAGNHVSSGGEVRWLRL